MAGSFRNEVHIWRREEMNVESIRVSKKNEYSFPTPPPAPFQKDCIFGEGRKESRARKRADNRKTDITVIILRIDEN
jgi:hypothetical protein